MTASPLALVHSGQRFEIRISPCHPEEAIARFRALGTLLEQAARRASEAGEEVDPQAPPWIRSVLEAASVPPDHREEFLELMAFQAAVAPVMMRVTQQMMRQAMERGERWPSLESPDLLDALRQDGQLSEEQMARVVGGMVRPDGGDVRLVVSSEGEGAETLWELSLPPQMGEGLTALAWDGEHLLLQGAEGTVGRVDVVARRLL